MLHCNGSQANADTAEQSHQSRVRDQETQRAKMFAAMSARVEIERLVTRTSAELPAKRVVFGRLGRFSPSAAPALLKREALR